MPSPAPIRAIRRRSASRSRISPPRPRAGRSRACASPCPTPTQLPDFHADVIEALAGLGEDAAKSLGAIVEPVKLPEWYFNLGGSARARSRPRRLWSLHRGWIEDMSQPIGAGVRGRAMAAKGFAPGPLCRGAAPHGAGAVPSSPTGCAPYDALLTPTLALGRDSGRRGRRDLARHLAYDAARQLSRPLRPRRCRTASRMACRSASSSLGKPYAEGTVLKIGKALQDATDFHQRAPDLSALGL